MYGSVRLRCIGNLCSVDKAQLSDESLGFFYEKRVVTIADSEEEFAPEKVLIRVGVDPVRDLVEPRKGAPVRGSVCIEVGMGDYQDRRHLALGAYLAGERRGRSDTEDGEER